MFVVSVNYKWEQKLVDFKNAFVNDNISEEWYVIQPWAFEADGKEKMCKAKESTV